MGALSTVLAYRQFLGTFCAWKKSCRYRRWRYAVAAFKCLSEIFKGNTGIDIALPSGMAKVSNKSSSVKLLAGQRLYQVSKNDFLPQKISLIPNQLKLWIEPSAPVFKGKGSLKLNLHFQIVRYGTDRPVDRPGSVYLKSNYYNLKIPDSIRLNKDGKAKTTIEVTPPRSNDRTFEGTVTLHSIMDQSGYNDVQDGLLKVRFTSP